jgi:hypothetical protein
MTKTEKMLRKYVAALLKYSEDSAVFNPDFTVQQIPKIFIGWGEIDFNMVHNGAGSGCCTCIGPERYKINIEHCNKLKNKFKESDRTKWRFIVSIGAIIISLISLAISVLNYTCKGN